VREARGDDTARLIEHLKKGDMAKEAERLLQGTGWLPEPLRTPNNSPAPPPALPDEPHAAAPLPEFLIDGMDRASEPVRAAAE
jgi:ParB family chromosome partitioning protein